MNQLLALVLAGHLIGDWIVQTDNQAANKMTSWAANQRHMLGYHITLLLCLLLAPGLLVWKAATIIGTSWITHSFIDRRWPVRWLMCHTGSSPFSEMTFGVIAVDQALHISILCLLVGMLGR